jgi:hypothetical protein
MSELKKYVITKTYKTQKTWFIYAKDEPNAIESINEDKPNMTQERNTSCNIEEDDSMPEDDLFAWLDRKKKT